MSVLLCLPVTSLFMLGEIASSGKNALTLATHAVCLQIIGKTILFLSLQ